MIWVVMPKLGRKVTGTNCPLPSEPGRVGNQSQQTPVGTEAAPRLIKRQYVRVWTGRDEFWYLFQFWRVYF